MQLGTGRKRILRQGYVVLRDKRGRGHYLEARGGKSNKHVRRRGKDLVNKLLHTCLQAPHLEFHRHQLIGAHDGVLSVSPALRQQTPGRLL